MDSFPNMLGKQKTHLQNSFGKVLRNLRTKANLSQEKLALDSNIQRNYVSLIELGRNQPTLCTIFSISKALKISPSDLMQLVEDEAKLGNSKATNIS